MADKYKWEFGRTARYWARVSAKSRKIAFSSTRSWALAFVRALVPAVLGSVWMYTQTGNSDFSRMEALIWIALAVVVAFTFVFLLGLVFVPADMDADAASDLGSVRRDLATERADRERESREREKAGFAHPDVKLVAAIMRDQAKKGQKSREEHGDDPARAVRWMNDAEEALIGKANEDVITEFKSLRPPEPLREEGRVSDLYASCTQMLLERAKALTVNDLDEVWHAGGTPIP